MRMRGQGEGEGAGRMSQQSVAQLCWGDWLSWTLPNQMLYTLRNPNTLVLA